MHVTFKTAQFERALLKIVEKLPDAERNGLAASIRAGRTAFHTLASKELNLPSTLVKGTAAAELMLPNTGGLTAIFQPKAKSVNAKETRGWRFQKSNRRGKGGLTVDMHLLSGGGSHPLHSPHGFVMPGGGREGLLMHRVKHGHGVGKGGLRQIKTTRPATLLGQETNPVRIVFVKTTELSLTFELNTRIEKLFASAGS